MTVEAFFSVDVEADGDIPGPYSMSSIGACVPGWRGRDGNPTRLPVPNGQWQDFYAELKPISDDFIPEAAAVSGLKREALIADGRDPAEAMSQFADWVDATCLALSTQVGETVRPIFAAYPLGYDWMWTYWYLMRFAGRSPFGHSTHLDMKTDYSARSGASILASTKRQMPKRLLGTGPHTHNALDDACEQGQMLMNLLCWDGQR